MHWITIVYIVSAVIVYMADVYREYRRGLIFLDDLINPLLPALCPFINTFLAALYIWLFVVDKAETIFIWKRKS